VLGQGSAEPLGRRLQGQKCSSILISDLMDQTSEAIVYSLSRLSWDLFATLTFRSSPRPRKAYGLAWRHLAHASVVSEVPYSKLLIALRSEHGGIGDRFHMHYLLGGCRGNLKTLAARLEHQWSPFGFAEVRKYDESLRGVSYVAKCLAFKDRYELGRFGISEQLTLSRSIHRVFAMLDQLRTNGARNTGDKIGGRRALTEPAIKTAA